MAEELLLEPGFLSQTLRSAHETAAEAEACADEARAAALHERAAQGYTRRQAAALARAVERLAAANAALVAERDDLRRDNAESRAIKAEMVAFKALFQQKFDALRDRLEAFRRDYPSPANPANATRPGDPDPPKSAVDLEAENRQLRAPRRERGAGRKDAIISRASGTARSRPAPTASGARASHEVRRARDAVRVASRDEARAASAARGRGSRASAVVAGAAPSRP
ncbi:hypothetical protein JL720_14046 [Aureococcus anophagefferens]|nr:hypothetical protein JL720_14046 [Aureococcus anophagefferens]